jgi:hypothetical protein
MFYLINGFTFLWSQSWKGIVFFLLTIQMMGLFFMGSTIRQVLQNFSPEIYVKPHLTLIFSDEEEFLNSKKFLLQLREVEEISPLSKEQLAGRLTSLWELATLEGQSHPLDSYHRWGLRVTFKSLKSGQILRTKIIEALNNELVTVSEIKVPESEKKLFKHPFFEALKKYHLGLLIVPNLLVWFLFVFFLSKPFNQYCWFIESYQRRKFVRAKIWGWMMGLLLFTGGFLFLIFEQNFWTGIFLVLPLILVPWALCWRELKWAT